MQKKINTIVVGCDNKAKAEKVEKLFTGFVPPVKVNIADNQDALMKLLKKKLPDIVVLHIDAADNGYIDWLKRIRKVKGIDEVPVIIYTGKSGKSDEGLLELLVERLKG